MKMLRELTLAAVLAAAAIGCDDHPSAAGGGMGGNPAAGMGGDTGGGGGGGAGGAGVPLVDWVTDLAVSYAPDTSPPDTVDDKVIIDTTDPQAFDSLLQR